MQLQREKLELNPVFSTAMQHGDHMTGYIRLINFSQKAAPEMRHAIADLQVHHPPACLYAQCNKFLAVCIRVSKGPSTLMLAVGKLHCNVSCKCLHPLAVMCLSPSNVLSQHWSTRSCDL